MERTLLNPTPQVSMVPRKDELSPLQGYLAHKKSPHFRTLQRAYA